MKNRIKIYIQYFTFWLTVFIISRYIFLFYEFDHSTNMDIKDWLLTTYHGLKLDLSVVGYIMLFVGLVFSFLFRTGKKSMKMILNGLTLFFLTIIGFVVISDLELYRNWGFRMDNTPLIYLRTPKEAMASLKYWQIGLLLVFVALFIFSFFKLYKWICGKSIAKANPVKWYYNLVFILFAAIMILPIRGGIGIAPMNVGQAYYSTNNFANHAAINVVWNALNSVLAWKDIKETYDYMGDGEAEILTREIVSKGTGGEARKVLTTNRPNIVLILLESFSIYNMDCMHEVKGVTPYLGSMAKTGMFFSNIYSAGDRSDKGIVASLSSFPAQPKTSAMKYPKKTASFNFLTKSLKEIGYKTFYYYGGDIDFASMRSFIHNAKFDSIVTMDDFDKSVRNSKWGVHDHVMFDRLFNDIKKAKEPFFKMLFTLSSHEPYEIPTKPKFKNDSEKDQYLNSINYTDHSLGEFIEKLKNTKQWENTLVICLADHGHRYPGKYGYTSSAKFHIPMIWHGGALAVRDTVIKKIGSQIDLQPTLLSQLGVKKRYLFAKDILAKDSPGFAFYVFNNGFGIVEKSGYMCFNNDSKKFIFSKSTKADSLLNMGKALMQYSANELLQR